MKSKSASIIVLSGGTSLRFGSEKSLAKIEEKSLIARIIEAIPSEFEIIIVGPDPVIPNVTYRCVQENPTQGGPAAGFKAGLGVCTSEIVVLIATDMPFATTRTINLLNSLTSNDDAVMYVDTVGFKQPLAAVYRVEPVEQAFARMGDINGKSMHELVSLLNVREIHMSHEVELAFIDIDTQEDLARAIASLKSLTENAKP